MPKWGETYAHARTQAHTHAHACQHENEGAHASMCVTDQLTQLGHLKGDYINEYFRFLAELYGWLSHRQ